MDTQQDITRKTSSMHTIRPPYLHTIKCVHSKITRKLKMGASKFRVHSCSAKRYLQLSYNSCTHAAPYKCMASLCYCCNLQVHNIIVSILQLTSTLHNLTTAAVYECTTTFVYCCIIRYCCSIQVYYLLQLQHISVLFVTAATCKYTINFGTAAAHTITTLVVAAAACIQLSQIICCCNVQVLM